jgi:hypothetical protein
MAKSLFREHELSESHPTELLKKIRDDCPPPVVNNAVGKSRKFSTIDPTGKNGIFMSNIVYIEKLISRQAFSFPLYRMQYSIALGLLLTITLLSELVDWSRRFHQ